MTELPVSFLWLGVALLGVAFVFACLVALVGRLNETVLDDRHVHRPRVE